MLRCDSPKPKTLLPVRPSAGFRAVYHSRLDKLIAELHNSILYWITAQWRKFPELAQDASPAESLVKEFGRLGKQWTKNIDAMAPKLAAYFGTKVKDRVDGNLRQILLDSGFAVNFKLTPEAKNAYEAVIGENVGLIKSIASEHLADVEGIIMRSVALGGDLGTATKAIQEKYGVTRNRAALIAKDQNNKATAVLSRQRYMELGIETAKWRHSGGGRKPRPSHVAADGKLYNVARGCLIDGEYIQPGQLINCRCVSQPVVEGFD